VSNCQGLIVGRAATKANASVGQHIKIIEICFYKKLFLTGSLVLTERW